MESLLVVAIEDEIEYLIEKIKKESPGSKEQQRLEELLNKVKFLADKYL